MSKHRDTDLLDGKALIEAKSKVDLIKRLTLLKGIENKDNPDYAGNLDTVATALVHSSILQNKDKDVRLQAACCIADIIRIFAPEAPYDEKQLERVFDLFIEQLKGLEHVGSPSYTRCFYLLERLSLVKAFVLLVDLSDDLLVKLFRTFFEIISPDHSSKVITHMIDVMANCVEDCTMSQALLDAILQNLLPSAKSDSPKAYELATQLVKRSAGKLQTPIAQFLSDALTSTKAAQSDLKNDSHSLLFELYMLAPSLLRDVIPSLELELKADTDEVRERAVTLVCRILSGSDFDAPQHLMVTLVNRLNDKSPSIRVTVLQYARALYEKHQESRKQIEAQLDNRARDSDERVRKAAVVAICEIAAEYSDAISANSINEVLLRLRDKKPLIRREAVLQLGALYRKLCVKHSRSWSPSDLAKFGAIPSKILSASFIQQDDSLRLSVEKVLEEDFIQPDASISDRVLQLLDLVSQLDDAANNALARILRDKKAVQVVFQAYLDARKKKPVDTEEVAKYLRIVAHRLASPGLHDKALPVLQKFEEKADSSVWKSLATLISPKTRYADLKKEKTALIKRDIVKKEKEYAEALVYRLTQDIVPVDGVPKLLSAVKAKLPPQQVISFITVLSAQFPAMFGSVGEQIHELLDSKDDRHVDLALVLFRNVGEHLDSDVVPQVKKELTTLCTTGLPIHAKRAARALLSIVGAQDSTVAEVVKKTAQLLQSSKGDKGAAPLAALSVFALHAPKVFSSLRAGVFEFILGSCLPGGRGVDFKLRALKVLTNALVAREAQQQQSDHSKDVLKVLLRILREAGEVTDDATTNEEDKIKLRAKAACCLLKLAKMHSYDGLITPGSFQLLAGVAQDPSFDVREAFGTKLMKFGQEGSLPARYLGIFALYAHDPDKQLHGKIKSALDASIRVKRELSKQHGPAGMHLLPENSIPHLVHLLAHRPQFGEDSEYKFEVVTGHMLLTALVHTSENIAFIIQLIGMIRSFSDAEKPNSDNHRIVCELLLKVLQHRADKKLRPDQPDITIHVPLGLFKRDTGAHLKENYLPAGFQLPDMRSAAVATEEHEPKPKRTPRKSEPKSARKGSAKRRKAASESEEEEGGDDESSSSERRSVSPEPRQGARKSSRAKSPRTKLPVVDSDGESERDTGAAGASLPSSPSPSKGKRPSKDEQATSKKKAKTKKGK